MTKHQNAIAEENCQVNDVVYKCDLTRPLPKKVYVGLAEREWKSCFCNYKLLFKHERYVLIRQLFQVTCGIPP